MSLYTKYRPKALSEVIGNQIILESLQAALTKADPPHAYLFHGPSGCGKTTLARISAQVLGCSEDDFREIDSADFRGIDSIREIRRQSNFQALHGVRRAWLLDECHKISADGQAALLKALEDPPPHVYYFLATTDPQKLLDTIKGRCASFQVAPLSEIQMKRLLRAVVKEEGQELEKEVYDQIIASADGRPRNALQILERVLDTSPDKRLQAAKKIEEATAKTIDLCRALIGNKPWSEIKLILRDLKTEDPESIRQSILGYCSAVLLNNENNKAAAIMEAFLNPTFNSGFPGIVYASYCVVFAAE